MNIVWYATYKIVCIITDPGKYHQRGGGWLEVYISLHKCALLPPYSGKTILLRASAPPYLHNPELFVIAVNMPCIGVKGNSHFEYLLKAV